MCLIMPNRIKELRAKNRMLQDTLARKVGVSQQTISKIENGKTVPYVDVMMDIAKVFNVSLDYLLCLTEEYRTLEYNDALEKFVNNHNDLLTSLLLLDEDQIDTVDSLVYSMIERKKRGK